MPLQYPDADQLDTLYMYVLFQFSTYLQYEPASDRLNESKPCVELMIVLALPVGHTNKFGLVETGVFLSTHFQ
jgi:hypothetical protein